MNYQKSDQFSNQSIITISAVGDISFMGNRRDKPHSKIFEDIRTVLQKADLTLGNLESPFVINGKAVPGKCILRGHPDWAFILKDAGFDIVSLANNHLMDFGIEGLETTIKALEEAQLYYAGAGRDEQEACAPRFVEIRDHRLAFLARTSVIVSSPAYAVADQPGVAFLDLEETEKNIKSCKKKADIVILMIHWGLEEYQYPSPRQRHLARKLIDAGADLVLGHHPHVLQGVENIGKGLACYSLGNFLFDDLRWTLIDKEGKPQEYSRNLSLENRKGGICNVILSKDSITSFHFLPTFIRTDATVKVDDTLERRRDFDRLCSRLRWPGYSLFWRMHSIKREWELRIKPLFQKNLTWSKFKKIRPEHFRYLLDTMKRCANITTEKSTNPYE